MIKNILSCHKPLIIKALVIALLFFGLGTFFVFNASTVSAAANLDVWSDPYSEAAIAKTAIQQTGLGNRDPREIIAGVIRVTLGLLGVIAVILIIYAGFVWMNAKGNEAQITKARKILTNAVIGLLIVLASYGIASYILKAWLGVTGGNQVLTDGGNGQGSTGGVGALGGGIIKTLYPVPNQTDVPRNTSIIITFKEPIDPSTICDKVENGKCATDAKINLDSVIISPQTTVATSTAKTLGENQDTETVEKVAGADSYIKSTDNLTFVLTPTELLGSPDGNIWYAVELTSKIKKATGKEAFGLSSFIWRFEVSSVIDLVPPQVVKDGLFPLPDNDQDSVGAIEPATAAKALITVKNNPATAEANRVSYTKINPNSVEIDAFDVDNNTCDGTLGISINSGSPLSANLDYNGMVGKVNEPAVAIVDRVIKTACGFDIQLPVGFSAGHAWKMTLVSEKSADYLMVGSQRYTFVRTAPAANEISLGATSEATALNIANALKVDTLVKTVVTGNKIELTAKQSGAKGNDINLSSNAKTSSLIIDRFSGGADANKKMTVKGTKDQPKNAIIQINFNEAIDPTYVSGDSEAVKDVVRVLDKKTNTRLAGSFRMSNSFKTLEFIPSEECGVNGCGETIYCLPANTEIVVELVAARLTAACTSETDCAKNVPFSKCAGSVCVDGQGAKYPEGQLGSGLTDTAKNSLDGNRNGRAEGPASWFDANDQASQGADNFRWSFWVSEELDITAPKIVAVSPTNNVRGVGIDEAVTMEFDKVMLSSSLAPGSTVIKTGAKEVEHKLVNLWAVDRQALGYWLEKNNVDNSGDGLADRTVAVIKHSNFNDSSLFKAQAGSGVKDIYQNCYKPCAGAGCNADSVNNSCCSGSPTKTGADSQCPN